jgi:SAM-dependent methyltransferase
MNLDNLYWNNRYLENEFSWDLGEISEPLKNYFNQLTDKDLKILIPGAGNAHEAEYLFNRGFKNIYILDFAEEPINLFKKRNPLFNPEHLICENFFDHKGQYDLIIEQTFFCAINPELRKKYAEHMHDLLKPKGKLVGLLFNDVLNTDHPPFGGNKTEYLPYFENLFKLNTFEPSYNSIKPRANRELFINFEKA